LSSSLIYFHHESWLKWNYIIFEFLWFNFFPLEFMENNNKNNQSSIIIFLKILLICQWFKSSRERYLSFYCKCYVSATDFLNHVALRLDFDTAFNQILQSFKAARNL
jgi:hypothetical protein